MSVSKRLPSNSPAPATQRSRIVSLSPDDCRLLVESVTDYAIFMLDTAGRVVTWNPGAERINGYAASDIIGQHFSTFYPQEDRDAGKPDRELATAAELGRIEDEGWRVRGDGTRYWANVIITALRDASGQLRGFGKVTRDLSQRRQAEEQLRQSEERFRLLVDAVSDYAIYMLDPEGRVSTWNQGAERMKGYRGDEIIGRSFRAFFPEADVLAGKPERELEVARTQGRFEEENWRVGKNGQRFWASVVLTAVRSTHGELLGFAKVTRDLTARRQAEEIERNLVREQTARAIAEEGARRAEAANRIKDEFLATVSHELRTPLNAIVGWATLLRQRELEPQLAKAIEVIERNAHAQVKIIEDILDVSRIVTGKLRIDPAPMDLVAMTQAAIDVIGHSARAKQISVHFEPEREVCLLVGDPERLQQVAWNLLSNAVKFTDSGGEIRIRIHQDRSNLVLTVSDTGRGIDPEFLPFVFDRFKQADASTTRRVGGLGLGLSLVRHIVELHGGHVKADSAGLGRGARFEVILPIRAMQPATAHTRQSPSVASPVEARPPRQKLEGVRVLVVDDDADAHDLLKAVLVDCGARVQTAGSALEGIRAVRRFRPHLLVSDVAMPEEDGYSLLRRVQALDPVEGGGIPCVALTAYARREDRSQALAAGFDAHLGKPVNPDDLISTVAHLASAMRR